MTNLVEQVEAQMVSDCFSDLEVQNLFPGSNHRRYGLMKRAIAKGEILHLRRGLYCLAEKYRRHPFNLFSLAQQIYGPSYISFESALSHHGWIPEAVRTVTSASLKRSREFATPLGMFHYTRINCKPFLAGVLHVSEENHSYFMAHPWKAIADFIYVQKKDWCGIHPLIHSLRIDEDLLQHTDSTELEEIEFSYKSRRVTRFFNGTRKDLKL